MDLIRASAWLHIVLAILLMGFALFWFFMEIALRKRHEPARARELLNDLTRTRWPHVIVPPALRIPLPWLSWLVIAALVVTGVPGTLARDAVGSLGMLKLALIAAILVVQLLMTRALRPTLIRINFALVAAVIIVSAWAIR